MLKKISLLALLYFIMANLSFFLGYTGYSGSVAVTIVLGFLLLAAFFCGKITEQLKLPMLTGYLLSGVVFGPSVLGVFSPHNVEQLRLIDSIAFGYIALSAGGEIRWETLTHQGRRVAAIGAAQFVFVFGGVFALFYPLLKSGWLAAAFGGPVALYAALLMALVAVSTSPAATVAIVNETMAAGRITETTFGIVVLVDVALFSFYVFLASWITADLGGQGAVSVAEILRSVFFEVALSLGVGALLGMVVILYISTIAGELVLFTLGLTVITAVIASLWHLNMLLMCMMIGFAARNFSPHGHKLIHSIEKVAMPIFIIFFALAGATLDLVVVKAMWFTALVYFIARFALMWGATAASAKWLREPEKVRKYLWGGFISQAGVSLGLAMMIRSQFPGWGAALSTLIIAEIAIAELAGPIIFKRALIASGEAGRQETSSVLRPATGVPVTKGAG